ncbi:hypothetical protein KC351_g48 [Hortaea werneckii]|nr:hypothetical protein KC351_g48 [Hortaea werneckii]
MVCSRPAESTGERGVGDAGALDGEGLAHDRAAAGDDLQVGHGAAAGSRRVHAGVGARAHGHGAESGRRRLVKERAHGSRLAEQGLHGGDQSRARSRGADTESGGGGAGGGGGGGGKMGSRRYIVSVILSRRVPA